MSQVLAYLIGGPEDLTKRVLQRDAPELEFYVTRPDPNFIPRLWAKGVEASYRVPFEERLRRMSVVFQTGIDRYPRPELTRWQRLRYWVADAWDAQAARRAIYGRRMAKEAHHGRAT